MNKYKHLELKVKILSEYLENGGFKKIPDPLLLKDIINVKKDHLGKVDEKSVSSRLNAFMTTLLKSRTSPPFFDNKNVSEYDHLLQKHNFFSQIQIDSESDFDRIYDSLKKSPNHLFRGQAEAKWRLYSSLQRNWVHGDFSNKGINFQTFLQNMLNEGVKDYSHEIERILGVSNADTINDLSVMGFLQHHGCPTPLLDWTYNFKVALFFAIDGISAASSKREIENYLSVYHIEEEYFKGGSVRSVIENSLDRLNPLMKDRLMRQICGRDIERYNRMKVKFEDSLLFDPSRYYGSGMIKHLVQLPHMINTGYGYYSDADPSSGIIFSMSNNPNIKNQEGVFTFNASPHFPLEMQAYEYSKEDYGQEDNTNFKFCDCININKSLVPYIREKLNNDGVTQPYIYPSESSKARYIYDYQVSAMVK